MREISPVSEPATHFAPGDRPHIDRAVRVILAGLPVGQTYRASDLYGRYVDYCAERMLRPCHPNSLGHGMRRYGARNRHSVNNERCWYLPTPDERSSRP